jgi:branched-subunit amino acid transport protein
VSGREFLLIGAMAVVTFTIRYGLFALSDRIRVDTRWSEVLGLVPAAVLAALVAPEIFLAGGAGLALTIDNPRLIGALAGTLAGLASGKLLFTIVTGMAGFLAAQYLLT